jgi:CheY-like chemotaxis protein
MTAKRLRRELTGCNGKFRFSPATADNFYETHLPAGAGMCFIEFMAGTNGAQAPKSSATIFVVDDEPMLLEMAVMILEPLNYRIRTFRDPQTALAEYSAANPRPALIVTDYAMHTMSGMDLIRECRRIHPQQKIILLSGTVDESIYANAPVKPDRFLAKPYQVSDFVKLVQSLTTG